MTFDFFLNTKYQHDLFFFISFDWTVLSLVINYKFSETKRFNLNMNPIYYMFSRKKNHLWSLMLVSNKENYNNGFFVGVFTRKKLIYFKMMIVMKWCCVDGKSKDQHAILCVMLWNFTSNISIFHIFSSFKKS